MQTGTKEFYTTRFVPKWRYPIEAIVAETEEQIIISLGEYEQNMTTYQWCSGELLKVVFLDKKEDAEKIKNFELEDGTNNIAPYGYLRGVAKLLK